MKMNHLKKVTNATYRDLDQISQLPEPIILQIQSFLPLKDAARTCILSKTWKDICSSYPILYFDHNLFGLQFLLSESGSVLDCSQIHKVIMDSFMDYVDYRLSRVNHQSLPLRKLGLSISVAESDINKYSSRIDHWIEMVTQAPCVQDLCFSVQVPHEGSRLVGFSYNLKLPILATKGLQFLSLRGCALTDCYNNHNMKISSSLRRLYLSHVIVMEDAWDSLACCCPFIEIIEVDECYAFFEKLALSRFPKSLKKASLYCNRGCKRVVITGTNLESIKFYGGGCKMELDVAACSCLRELIIKACSFDFVGQLDFFQNFTAIFPVLEEVVIAAEPSNSFGLKCLKVASHHHLRTLVLWDVGSAVEKAYIIDCPNLTSLTFYSDLKELYIDCPNLKQFTLHGSTIPSVLLFNASADMLDMEWFIFCSRMDALGFIQLREFVKQMSGWSVNLSLHVLSCTASFTPEEHLGEVQDFAGGCNVNLDLTLTDECMQNQTSLLNWLLWSTCPSTLTIAGYGYNLIKDLCDKLSNKYEEDEACNDKPFCSKHWWHHVKDFEVECSHLEIQDIKGNLPVLVELYKTTRSESTFRFHWYSHDVKAKL